MIGEVVLDTEAAPEIKLRCLALEGRVWWRRFISRICQIKQAVQVCAQRDVLKRGRCPMIPNGTIRQHPRVKWEIPHATILAVIAVHTNLKPPFEMIHPH